MDGNERARVGLAHMRTPISASLRSILEKQEREVDRRRVDVERRAAVPIAPLLLLEPMLLVL